MLVILNTVVPVFSIIALGFWVGGWRGVHVRTLADLAILITSPALIFALLAETTVDPAQWAVLIGGGLWIVAGTGLLVFLYLRTDSAALRGLALPAVFWNAGNMALPCARLAFGEPGLQAAVILFVLMVSLQSSVAIWIAKGDGGGTEMFRMPLLYACVGGLAVAVLNVRVPAMVLEPVRMVGDMAIPLMLINLGVQLRALRVTDVRHAIVGVGIRIGGGLACALVYVWLVGVTGVNRQVLLLSAIMPAAVINVVIAQRYNTSPALVASTIVLGTACSVVTIPLLLAFLT